MHDDSVVGKLLWATYNTFIFKKEFFRFVAKRVYTCVLILQRMFFILLFSISAV